MVNSNHYNSYNQAKDIQTVSDIIGFGIWQFNVFIFQTVHALYLPVFNHGIAFYDIDTTFICTEDASGNNTDFNIQSFTDELGFNQQKCRLMSSECNHFQYNINSKYEESLIKSLDLPCERTSLKYWISSSYQIGCLFSILLYFMLCKRFGRACLTRFLLLVELLANIASSFITNFYGYLVARFFLGIGSFGCFLLVFILLMEIVSKKIRSEICILVHFGWTLGNIVLTLIMSFVLFNYVHLERCLIALQVLLLIWSLFLKESPKWLLLNGYYNQAEKALTKAGKNFNKLTNYEIKGRLMLLREHLIEQEVNQKFNFSRQTRSSKDFQLILKAISLVFTWFVCKLIYFTVSYYPELFTKKSGNFLEENAFYQSLVELASFLLTYLLVKFVSKRIHILVFALFFIIISIFGELLFFKMDYFDDKTYNYYLKLTFMLIIKFGASLIMQFLFLFTGECFNENLHQKIYGYSMVFGFIGAVMASFVPLFINYCGLIITLILFGILAILNLFAVIWMPELVQTSSDVSGRVGANAKQISDITNMNGSMDFSFKIEE